MTMPSRSFTTAAVSLAALPFAVGAFVWHGFQVRRQFWIDIDPFEIDLELHARNDEPA